MKLDDYVLQSVFCYKLNSTVLGSKKVDKELKIK
jgi:hypothetical protein